MLPKTPSNDLPKGVGKNKAMPVELELKIAENVFKNPHSRKIRVVMSLTSGYRIHAWDTTIDLMR